MNKLDEACKVHDISYSKTQELQDRHIADRALLAAAEDRLAAKDATFGEKASSWIVKKAMQAKLKMGAGHVRVKKRNTKTTTTLNKKKNGRNVGGALKKKGSFRSAVKAAREAVKYKKFKTEKDGVRKALLAAKKVIKPNMNVKVGRILSIPKRGGILPFLIPLFAALSAAGSLSGGIAGIASAVNKAKAARKELEESKRHNSTMEAIALKGKGLYIRPYKEGLGLYVNSQKN